MPWAPCEGEVYVFVSVSRMCLQKVSKLVWSIPGLPWNIWWMAPVLLVDMMIFDGGELSFMIRLCIIIDAASRAFISKL